MGINLESDNLRRQFQRQPISGWSRAPDTRVPDQPVRIHTLGRFSIQLYGQAVYGRHVRQHRPVELLQALIALGGRDVGIELISHALWPDADGDLARSSFEVTLHRLRRLFGISDLLQLQDRRLTLNSNFAWVDAWSFERLVNHTERLLPHADDPMIQRQLGRVGERLLNLYQGNFLDREPGRAWSLSLRERLRSKLLRHIIATGQLWERTGEWQRAIGYYRKGLEIDPLTEVLYQRLMICHRETGHLGDALATYERCEQVLYQQFSIRPSASTLALRATLTP
jgi:DNA-binding SARP family transcriptional activator